MGTIAQCSQPDESTRGCAHSFFAEVNCEAVPATAPVTALTPVQLIEFTAMEPLGPAAGWLRAAESPQFTKSSAANHDSLGVFYVKHLIRLMQANAKRLDKFGA
jgi:hypothetical protein